MDVSNLERFSRPQLEQRLRFLNRIAELRYGRLSDLETKLAEAATAKLEAEKALLERLVAAEEELARRDEVCVDLRSDLRREAQRAAAAESRVEAYENRLQLTRVFLDQSEEETKNAEARFELEARRADLESGLREYWQVKATGGWSPLRPGGETD